MKEMNFMTSFIAWWFIYRWLMDIPNKGNSIRKSINSGNIQVIARKLRQLLKRKYYCGTIKFSL